jgi:hypothetical protein
MGHVRTPPVVAGTNSRFGGRHGRAAIPASSKPEVTWISLPPCVVDLARD